MSGRILVDRRATPREPAKPEPGGDLAIWVSGIAAALSIILTITWIVSLII